MISGFSSRILICSDKSGCFDIFVKILWIYGITATVYWMQVPLDNVILLDFYQLIRNIPLMVSYVSCYLT